eukprot:7035477-Pyramimonas_sp.AAC.1
MVTGATSYVPCIGAEAPGRPHRTILLTMYTHQTLLILGAVCSARRIVYCWFVQLGMGSDGAPVFLRDIWPSTAEVDAVVASSVKPEMFRSTYSTIATSNPMWNALPEYTSHTGQAPPPCEASGRGKGGGASSIRSRLAVGAMGLGLKACGLGVGLDSGRALGITPLYCHRALRVTLDPYGVPLTHSASCNLRRLTCALCVTLRCYDRGGDIIKVGHLARLANTLGGKKYADYTMLLRIIRRVYVVCNTTYFV